MKHRMITSPVMIVFVLVVVVFASYIVYPVLAQSRKSNTIHLEYKVERFDGNISVPELQQRLNEVAAEGWELQTIITPLTGGGGYSNLIFRKSRVENVFFFYLSYRALIKCCLTSNY